MAEDLPEIPMAPEEMPESPIVNVMNPSGRLVGLPADQAQDAIQNGGYSPATSEDINRAKFSSPLQQAGTVAEGLAEGIAGPFATGAERLLGIPGEEILGRREANPIAHGASQIGGLGLGLATGVGEGALLTKAGALGSKALGLQGTGLASKLGSKAVQAAVENGLFQAGDEGTKLLAGDPNQSAETAVSNIGYSALFGGGLGLGLGAVNPLWKATMGGKLNTFLQGVSERLGGKEGVVSDVVDQAMTNSGLEVPPEVRAATSSDPWVRSMASSLEQSDTTEGGRNFQQAMQNTRSEASKGILESLGKTDADLNGIRKVSDFESGQTVQNQIAQEYKAVSEPIAKAYEGIETRFKGVDVPEESKALMQENLAHAAEEQGWKLLPDSDELKLVTSATQGLNNVQTLEDLRKLQSNIGAKAVRDNLWKAKSALDSVFSQGREALLDSAMGNEAPELKAQFKQTQAQYRELMQATDELNSRLKVGNPSGPKDFLFKLGEQTPEVTLNRLAKTNDAGLLSFLSEKFPQTANSIRNFHVDSILEKSAESSAEGMKLNSTKALKAINQMTPELRQFSLPPEAAPRVEAIETFLKSLEDSHHNFSNTARTVDKLGMFNPGSALAMVSWLSGHNPAIGFLLQPLAKYLGRDVPAAAKLALLKFLGSSAPLEAGGFKSMVDFIHHVLQGESTAQKAVKGLFKGAQEVLPQTSLPSEKDRDKLDKRLQKLQTDPHAMLDLGGATGHYLPDHGTALAQMGVSAAHYLNQLRPVVAKQNPLDSELKPTKIQLAEYHHALDIAEQPLSVLKELKENTLTSQSLMHLKALYPSLYPRLVQKVSTEMMNTLSRGDSISYPMRMGLSLFLGQPLDSSLTPEGIQSAQATFLADVSPQQGQGHVHKPAMNSFKKLAFMDQTPLQHSLQH